MEVCFSYAFDVKFGVRQGSVLSPFLFALYLDDIWNNGKLISNSYVILYADDILLISSSVCELQRTFDAFERERMWLDIWLLIQKNHAVFGLAREMIMSVLTLPPAKATVYRGQMKYVILAIWNIAKSRQFRCSIYHARKSFFSFCQRNLW